MGRPVRACKRGPGSTNAPRCKVLTSALGCRMTTASAKKTILPTSCAGEPQVHVVSTKDKPRSASGHAARVTATLAQSASLLALRQAAPVGAASAMARGCHPMILTHHWAHATRWNKRCTRQCHFGKVTARTVVRTLRNATPLPRQMRLSRSQPGGCSPRWHCPPPCAVLK